jgi:phosphohistidine phosphatase
LALVLYLVRHAIAEEPGPDWPDDAQRPLTADGIARMRRAVRGLDALDLRIDGILTSPLVRARQTADVLHEELSAHPRVDTFDVLAAGASPTAVIAALASWPTTARLALVGHEPDLGRLAARLIGARREVPFKKGAVCCIDTGGVPAPARGRLRWFAPPRLLRRLG